MHDRKAMASEYNALALTLAVHSMVMRTDEAEAKDVKDLLRRAYMQRANLNAAIERAEKALGIGN